MICSLEGLVALDEESYEPALRFPSLMPRQIKSRPVHIRCT